MAADQTITFGTGCFNINHENVNKNKGASYQISAPTGTTITWDSSVATEKLGPKTVRGQGLLTWVIPNDMPANTYTFNVQSGGVDLGQCDAPEKPSMTVNP